MDPELTENMKAVVLALGAVNHGKYNGGVLRGLYARGVINRLSYRGVVLTERGFFHWLFLIGEIDEATRDQWLQTARDD